MVIPLGRPWSDTYKPGETALFERYALRALSNGEFIGVAPATQLIERVGDPTRAWAFRNHARAVVAAKELSSLYGDPIDVVKLPSG